MLSISEYKGCKSKATKGFRASVLKKRNWENYSESAITEGSVVERMLLYDLQVENVQVGNAYIFRYVN